MIRRLHFFALALLAAVTAVAQTRNKAYLDYIEQYKEIAIGQMLRYRIPASITLAQALHESGAGRSTLALGSNNPFGNKCGKNWTGKTYLHDDDARNECFRVYSHVENSFEDHSVFLFSQPRYASLFQLPITDYKAWAHGLKKAGYATNPQYAELLIRIIELYDLQQYDLPRKERKSVPTTLPLYPETKVDPTGHETFIANNLVYVLVRKGDTLSSLAEELGISVRKLMRYNELYKGYPLAEGEIIYLEPKHSKALAPYTWHRVEPGESMHTISQRYGMRLKKLYKLNAKTTDYLPQTGDLLRVR